MPFFVENFVFLFFVRYSHVKKWRQLHYTTIWAVNTKRKPWLIKQLTYLLLKYLIRTHCFCSLPLQTELTCQRIAEFETQASSDLEVRNNKIDELTRSNEELRHQVSAHTKSIDQHKSHINKCIDVVKKLLIEKSNIEKKEARQR